MAIRYKVVRYDRTSTFALGKYRLTYIKDRIVEAIEGTLGVLVFKRRWEAKRYMVKNVRRYDHPMILRVETFSRGKTIRTLCPTLSERYLNAFYIDGHYPNTYHIPLGTMGYDKVRVLD